MSPIAALSQFGFISPSYLWALLLIPLLVAVTVVLRRRRSRYAVAFTNVELLAGVMREARSSWRRRLPVALLLLGLVTAGTALARPRVQFGSSATGTTIMLLVDASGSMQATDVVPSRLGAAVAAMQAFLTTLPKGSRVGLMSATDQAEVITSPTTDHAAVASGLNVLTAQGGTGLGAAVEQAVKILVAVVGGQGVHPTAGQYLPAAIVMATDGGQNRGTIGLGAAAAFAKAAGVRIYGVTVGTADGTITKGAGLIREEFPVPVDPGTVALLARETGGEAFNAYTANGLETISRHLGASIGTQFHRTEITSWFEIAAAILIMIGFGTVRLQTAALP